MVYDVGRIQHVFHKSCYRLKPKNGQKRLTYRLGKSAVFMQGSIVPDYGRRAYCCKSADRR